MFGSEDDWTDTSKSPQTFVDNLLNDELLEPISYLRALASRGSMAQEVELENPRTGITQCATIVQTTIQEGLCYFGNNWTLVSQQTCVEMEAGAFYIPKDRRQKPLGEDAYFIDLECQTLGVADGVGGWNKRGIDAGEYARQLMKNSRLSLLSKPKAKIDPKEVLIEAHSLTKVPGSSTACIVTLVNQVLHYANVGDSGFMVLRDGKKLSKSLTKQRRFNAPCHLGNGGRFTPPSEAIEGKIDVIPGDVVVAGTDGLFDNMFEREIERTVTEEMARGSRPQQVAQTLAKLALYNSLDEYFQSPFSEAAEEAGQEHVGGKKDDITVVVAFIRRKPEVINLQFEV